MDQRTRWVVRRMKKAAKSGGYIVVLDYNHEDNSWEPDPPAEFCRFYRAFLDWRTANKWDNRIADRLPDLFRRSFLIFLLRQGQVTPDRKESGAPQIWGTPG